MAYERNWGFAWNTNCDGGDVATTTKNAIIALKEAFTADLEDAAGTPGNFTSGKWTVQRSSDGTTADATDRWVDNTDITFDTAGNNHSWIWLSKADFPTVGVTTHVIIDCVDTTNTDVTVHWSSATPTDNGSVTNSPTLTAGTAYTDLAARQIASYLGTNVTYSHASRSDNGDVFFGTWRQGHPRPWYGLLTNKLDPSPRSIAIDPWPMFIYHGEYDSTQGTFDLDSSQGLDSWANAKSFWHDGTKHTLYGFYTKLARLHNASAWVGADFDTNGDDIDGKWPRLPLYCVTNYTAYKSFRGRVVDLWDGPRAGSSSPPLGTVTPATGTVEYCLFGDIWVPANQAPVI